MNRLFIRIRFITRRCANTTVIKNVTIPAGLCIRIDSLSLHYNPEYWGGVDPNELYPMRFDFIYIFEKEGYSQLYYFNQTRFANKANHNQMANTPFGIGPRTCVGMRFALLEVKSIMVKILKNYNVNPTHNVPKGMLDIIKKVSRLENQESLFQL